MHFVRSGHTYDLIFERLLGFLAQNVIITNFTMANLDLILGPPWNTTTDGRPLILADDGDQDRMIIVCTQENLTRYLWP